MSRDEIIASLRSGSWRDRIPEDAFQDPFGAAADLIEKLERELASEERQHSQTVDDRDAAQDAADDLVNVIERFLGVECGEHAGGTPGNCPWANALEFMEAEITKRAAGAAA